jgi:hypothetical protein
LDIPRNARAIPTDTALSIHKVLGLAESAEALGDLRSLPSEAVVCLTRCCSVLLALCQMRCCLWTATWTRLVRLAGGGREWFLNMVQRCCRSHNDLCGSAYFGRHGSCDRLAQGLLHMEEVRRVLRPQMGRNGGQESWGLIACRLDAATVAPHQGLLHAGLPGVVIACASRVLQENGVAHGLHPHQRQTACPRFILGAREVLSGHRLGQARTLLLAVQPDGLFHVTVHLLLGSIGSADKPIETCYLQ